MYIIIAGGGLIGKGLARRLSDSKHDIVVIEPDVKACEEIYAKYGAITITGNSTQLEIVKNAGIEKCDVAIAATDSDANNLAFAVLAKHFNVSQIMVRMNDSNYEDVYKSVGITNITKTTELIIDQLMVSVETPYLSKVTKMGDLEICFVNVSNNSRFVGIKISKIVKDKKFPKNIIITSIYRDKEKQFIVPYGDTIINDNDRVFMCGKDKDIKKAANMIRSKK